GFGHYDEQAYAIVDHGPCFPDSGSELADAGWPGPLAGTTLTAAPAWEGAFVPIYYFAGYGYAEGEIAIQGRRGEHFARAYNTLAKPYDFRPTRCGVLGIGREGVRACPDQSVIQEALVWFAPDSVALPAATTHGMIDALTCPPEVASILAEYSVRHVARAHPAAVKDTVGFTTRSGKIAVRTDYTAWFSFVAADSVEASSLAAAAGTARSVFGAFRDGLYIHFLRFPSELGPGGQYQHWHLHNHGIPNYESDIDIDAPQAWNLERGDDRIKLGIVDYSIEGPGNHHPDLRPLWRTCPWDPGSEHHGIGVAGIVGAETDSPGGEGVAAVDWEASIGCYPVCPNYTDPLDAVLIMEVVDAAVDDGCSVLNHSWGVRGGGEAFRPAFIRAYIEDVLAVAAIGQNESHPLWPGGRWDTGQLSVGAIDCRGALGATSQLPVIDVVAPGVDIPTLDIDGGYRLFTGSSAAAPVVSGIATLLLAYGLHHEIDLSVDDVAQLIRLGAVDMGAAGWDLQTGWGRANAYNSLYILANAAAHTFKQMSAPADETLVCEAVASAADYNLYQVPWSGGDPYSGLLTLTKYAATMPVDLGEIVSSGRAPVVWGRGTAMYGYGLDSFEEGEVLWGYGHCDTVGTATEELAILRTYLYREEGEGWWFPCAPEEIVWRWGVFAGPA
ncbi:MAG: S8 family serine peptidase, partial [Candidatus Eisenbacteria bacterium]|nr:S8 family serine peptidase [Candidatus Eisenbacteria bacterium]